MKTPTQYHSPTESVLIATTKDEANARLIAAAPSLVSALTQAILQRKGREPKWEAQARAALAKAGMPI
jgi:hypothetical protein